MKPRTQYDWPETWYSLPNFPSYQISDHNRVRGSRGKLRSIHLDKDGYAWLTLFKDGERSKRLLHRLICEAAHGPRPSPEHRATHYPRHDRQDNRAINLRWSHHLINDTVDRDEQGTLAVSFKMAREIREAYYTGVTQKELQHRYGLMAGYLPRIIYGSNSSVGWWPDCRVALPGDIWNSAMAHP